jgi:ribonuclease HII
MTLRGVPLAEIRRRYIGQGERVSPAVRAALREDPRVGAKALARTLELRRARRVAEKRRLRELFRMERRLALAGITRVAGVDEVGVGPLAGPVVAAAVVLPGRVWLPRLNDSKRLTPAARDRLDAEIRRLTNQVSVGLATPEEIDQLNIYQAGLLAMRRAVEGLPIEPEMLLVDARRIPEVRMPQRAVIGGDSQVACIAAASIVAKVHRDRLMRELDRRYPGYGFSTNVGYGTAEHLRALRRRGPTVEHRQSFAPVVAAAAQDGQL